MTLDNHLDIVDRLNAQDRFKSIAERISRCDAGSCKRCGDVCPIKLGQWADKHSDAIEDILSANAARPIWHINFVRERWARDRNGLKTCSVDAVKKSVRRSLDALRQPTTVAIGHVDAWYAWRKWEIGATLLVAGPDESERRSAFPSQSLYIREAEVASAVLSNLKSAYHAKRSSIFALEGDPPKRRRGEYYAWLASVASESRLIRYGTDRYFNRLAKVAKPANPKVKRARKYPRHLIPFMFGNHPINCQCMGCGGLGKYHDS